MKYSDILFEKTCVKLFTETLYRYRDALGERRREKGGCKSVCVYFLQYHINIKVLPWDHHCY